MGCKKHKYNKIEIGYSNSNSNATNLKALGKASSKSIDGLMRDKNIVVKKRR